MQFTYRQQTHKIKQVSDNNNKCALKVIDIYVCVLRDEVVEHKWAFMKIKK